MYAAIILNLLDEQEKFDSESFSMSETQVLNPDVIYTEFGEPSESEVLVQKEMSSTETVTVQESESLTVLVSDTDTFTPLESLVSDVTPVFSDVDFSDVGEIPFDLPFHLGGLQRPRQVSQGGTFGLPFGIPWNISNRGSEAGEDFDLRGWHLRCISGTNFETVLALINKFTGMSFTLELNGTGAGSVSFNLDDALFTNQLTTGDDPGVLLERENMWEVWLDGYKVFSWLSQTDKEGLINQNEDRTVNLSGPGIAEVLNWAKIMPNQINRFGNGGDDVALKLEEFTEEFNEPGVDFKKWNYFGGPGGIPSWQGTEEGQLMLYVSANTWNAGGKVFGARVYDFVDTGISARVTPMPQGPNPSSAYTVMEISPDDGTSTSQLRSPDVISIYTSKVGSTATLTFQVVSNNELVWSSARAFSSTNDLYWRIREYNGKALFDTAMSLEGPWTEVVESDVVPWDMSRVVFQFRVYTDGNTGLTLGSGGTAKAYFSEVNQTPVPSSQPLMTRFRKYIEAAQDRGTITFLDPEWTDEEDSAGASWVGTPNAEARLGTSLLALLEEFCNIQACDWIMRPDFKLELRQREWNEGDPDPTVQFHKEDEIVFHEGGHQLSKERTRIRKDIANYVVGKTVGGLFRHVTDSESKNQFTQRELYVDPGAEVKDEDTLTQTILNYLSLKKDQETSWTIQIPHDSPSRRAFKDFSIGDWVGFHLEEVSGLLPSTIEAQRIIAISASVDGDGFTNMEITLQSKFDLLSLRIQRLIDKLQNKLNEL